MGDVDIKELMYRLEPFMENPDVWQSRRLTNMETLGGIDTREALKLFIDRISTLESELAVEREKVAALEKKSAWNEAAADGGIAYWKEGEAEITQLREALEKANTPEWYWEKGNPENPIDEIEDYLNDWGPQDGTIVELCGARETGRFKVKVIRGEDGEYSYDVLEPRND